MYIKTVSDLLSDQTLRSVAPEATVKDACSKMSIHNVGALPVVDGDQLVGILSERDVIRRCITGERNPVETKVADIMTHDPQTVSLDCTPADAIDSMLIGGYRHLPVCDGDVPVGMVSMRDIPTENRLMVERFRDYTGIQAVYG